VGVVLVATAHARTLLGVGGAAAVPSATRDGDPTYGSFRVASRMTLVVPSTSP